MPLCLMMLVLMVRKNLKQQKYSIGAGNIDCSVLQHLTAAGEGTIGIVDGKEYFVVKNSWG